jgi:preprotein translocase subunit SecE
MKKQKRKQVQNTAAAPITAAAAEGATTPPKEGEAAKEKEAKQRSFPKPVPKKPAVKKARQDFLPVRYYQVSRQFLKESKLELKKVKWPTRKELLASTAVVIALTLLLSFYLGIVDFGLVKIIKTIVG